MTDAITEQSPESETRQSRVPVLLQEILALPSEERAMLMGALNAGVDGGQAGRPSASIAVDESRYTNDVEEWIERTKSLAPRARYAALEEGLAEAETDWAYERVQSEMKKMRDASASFAIEVTVTRHAINHPIMTFIGLVGLGLALFHGARGVWRVIF